MPTPLPIEKVDYLIIGHFSKDLTPDGARLGGTTAYAALTARALGLRVGIVSSFNKKDISLDLFADIPIIASPSEKRCVVIINLLPSFIISTIFCHIFNS